MPPEIGKKLCADFNIGLANPELAEEPCNKCTAWVWTEEAFPSNQSLLKVSPLLAFRFRLRFSSGTQIQWIPCPPRKEDQSSFVEFYSSQSVEQHVGVNFRTETFSSKVDAEPEKEKHYIKSLTWRGVLVKILRFRSSGWRRKDVTSTFNISMTTSYLLKSVIIR